MKPIICLVVFCWLFVFPDVCNQNRSKFNPLLTTRAAINEQEDSNKLSTTPRQCITWRDKRRRKMKSSRSRRHIMQIKGRPVESRAVWLERAIGGVQDGGSWVSPTAAGGAQRSHEVKSNPLSRISVAGLEMSPMPACWIKARLRWSLMPKGHQSRWSPN